MQRVTADKFPNMSADVANLVKLGVYSLFQIDEFENSKLALFTPGGSCSCHSQKCDIIYLLDETGKAIGSIDDIKSVTIIDSITIA